jgi:shikimate dehydrogenase
MSDLYCVFGNPIGHSRSPAIHAQFAAQTGEDLVYETRLAPLDDFAGALAQWHAAGGRGANVTVPFKEEAFRLCDHLSDRARLAGAVNTLRWDRSGLYGDNTDGVGLVRDIEGNLGFSLSGRRLLLLGAGGAARGALAPLLATTPSFLTIANRSADKAQVLVDAAASEVPFDACGFDELAGREFDCVINATSASLGGATLPLPDGLYATGALAYDMMYGKSETPFLAQARKQRAARCEDGLGMLVEQAAAAFELWRDVRPATAPVLARLRRDLAAT